MKVFTLGTLIAQIDVSVVKGSTGPNRVREMLPSLSVITFHESNEKHVTCQARGGRLIEIWPQHADLSHRRRPIEEQENGTEAQETCGRNTDTRDERTCAPYQDSVSHSPTLPHSHPSPGTNFQNRGLPKYRDIVRATTGMTAGWWLRCAGPCIGSTAAYQPFPLCFDGCVQSLGLLGWVLCSGISQLI